MVNLDEVVLAVVLVAPTQPVLAVAGAVAKLRVVCATNHGQWGQTSSITRVGKQETERGRQAEKGREGARERVGEWEGKRARANVREGAGDGGQKEKGRKNHSERGEKGRHASLRGL